jgi:hypothetical protein
LVRLRDAQGAELPLPADPTTPLALVVPAGVYTAWLRDAASGREHTCTATVAAGEPALCTVTLRRLRAEELVGGVP